jgi:hypothetical protein
MNRADDDFERLERAFWLAGPDHYRSSMTPGCIMVFPGIGALGRDEIIAAVEAAPRWSRVAFADWQRDDPAGGVAIVAYRAAAEREGEAAPYRVHCGSVYVRTDAGWRLAFHQQTPADAPR